MRPATLAIAAWLAASSAHAPARAGEADVLEAGATAEADGRYRFTVTVGHEDAGWDHYADRWEVVGPDGEVLATRVLHHPHTNEQPFTRSLGGVEIPAGVERVELRAHDSVHGLGGTTRSIELPGR